MRFTGKGKCQSELIRQLASFNFEKSGLVIWLESFESASNVAASIYAAQKHLQTEYHVSIARNWPGLGKSCITVTKEQKIAWGYAHR